MRVLVTGANGFLGSQVVERLLRSNHQVVALIRPAAEAPGWADRVAVHRVDLRVADGLVEALKGIDVVVHVAAATSGSEDQQFASTVGGTEKLLSAMGVADIKRIVLISSFVLYDWSKAKHILDEDSPLEADIYRMGGYTIAKAWQERLVLAHAKETGCKVTILRPGFIWGKGHAELAGMGRKVGPVFVVVGPGNELPLTHVINCADCVVTATEAELPSPEVFNIVDRPAVSAWRYTGDYLRRSRIRARRLPMPYGFGRLIASSATSLSSWKFGARGQLPSLLTKRRYEAQFKPLRFSTAKVERVLNWTPPLSYQECLDATFPG